MWKIWLITAGVCLLIEALTTGFLLFWFFVGALIAMIVSFFIKNIIIQTIIFLVSSTICILCTRKLLNPFMNKATVPTNVYSTIGKRGIVTLEINPTQDTGQIKVDGQIWSARCDPGMILPEGTDIKIERIDGVKAFVRAVKENI